MQSSSSLLDNILSGPIEGDVLWMQPEHVSEHVWNKEEDRKLLVRRAVPTHKGIREIPQAIVPYLHQSSFYGVARMQYVEVNASLISALVERWRPETHTFHMPFGECTITLQDVAVQLGLPVDGEPVIGPTKCDWGLLCEELLGVRPASLSGSTVKLSWLAENFGDVAHHMDSIEKLQCYARAYILRLIGGVLFVDKWIGSNNFLTVRDDLPSIRLKIDKMKRDSVEDTGQQVGLLGNNSEYMRWFKRKSKIYLTLSWAKVGLLGDIGENLWYMSSEEGQNTWTRTDLRKEAEKILAIAEEEDRVCESATSAPASAPQFEVGAFDIPSHRSEGHGLGRRRRTIDPETYVIPPISELQPGSTLP
ncbi:hypothetical protein VNO78_15612 [Psophocarpus tetragonolobus]|uniref:Aminotransferase-like plant mobile domain-containing protein n=1 Tax=Psophocarpus tetragonolobus TaxID=3891 RepID=A0AAN9XJR9_PSOTE